jgi:putative ABC transport system permease protein
MSMYVANRRREFGIRAAIGARPGELVRVVAGEGAALVGGGVVIGLLVSLVAGRVIRSLLYEVSPNDAAVYVGVAGVLVVVGALACYLPARRAANSDPLLVLRQE